MKHVLPIFKKLKMIALALLLVISSLVIMPTTANAVSSISKVSANTVFDAEYGFSYRFISGVTQVSTFGLTNKKEDQWSTNDTHGNPSAWANVRLTSDSQKGKIGAWYRNVGTYQGKIVDLKMTVTNWTSIRKTNLTVNGKPNYPTVEIGLKQIIVSPQANSIKGLEVTYEFFEHNTNTRMNIKGHANLFDIDNGEFAKLSSSNIVNAYFSENTELTSNGGTAQSKRGTTSTNGDRTHWCTVFINGNSIKLSYDRVQDNNTAKNRAYYQFGFTGDSVSPFNTPYLNKSVNKSVMMSNEELIYTFNTNIPQQPSNKKYTSFTITDKLDNALQVVNGSLTVMNDANQNVTNQFSLNQSGQTVTISGNSYVSNNAFYNKAYKFTFKVKPKDNYNFTPSGGKVNIANVATVTTNYGSRNSNTVNTEVKFKILTQSTNASITPSINSVKGGSNQTITWNANDGYWISSVLVDGVSQPINSYRGGSYTFSNIGKDHEVRVVANPCYTITTEVVNGNITENQTKIEPKENRTIQFSPKSGYYVSEVIVDGHAYSYKDYASSYTFKNINENHHIKVVCEPLKTITTEIVNGVIDKTMTGLHPDDIKSIYYNAFDEYYIESVELDGKNIPVDDFVEGHYTFDPVITDHTLRVVCQPKPRITTEIKNGIITPEMTVFPYENATVISNANDNYYISRVIVDGQEIKDFEEYRHIQNFTDVVANHHVYVECEPMPVLSLKKTTDKQAYNYNDIIHYTVQLEQTVENAIASNVHLRDSGVTQGVEINMDSLVVSGLDEDKYTLQKNSNDFSLDIKEIQKGQIVTVTFDAQVVDSRLVGKTISNSVYATCDHFNNQIHQSVTNDILKPELSINKSTIQDKYNVLEDIEYSVIVNQTVENAKAFDVLVEDIIPENVDVNLDSFLVEGIDDTQYTLTKNKDKWSLVIKELNHNQNVVVSFKGQVTEPTLAGHTITNTATVTSKTNTQTKQSSATIELLKPKLVLSKTSDKDYYNVEDDALFTIALAQSVKDAIAYNVVLKDTDISNGVDIDWKSLQISGLNDDNYTIRKYNDKGGFEIIIKKLGFGDVVNITYNARINDNSLAGSELRNSVQATCDNNVDVIKATVTKPILKPEFTIEKGSNLTDYNVGDELEFVLKVNQTKENAIANHVIIRDFDLSEGVELDLNSIRVEGIDETLYTINRDNDNNTFNVEINALAFNQEVIIRVKGQVTEPTLAGHTITNSASVSASNNNKVVTDNVTAHIYKPELHIEKASEKAPFNYNDWMKYTIRVNQTVKGAKANDVVLKDELPKGLELDMNSFTFEGINPEEVKVEKTDKGFKLTIAKLSHPFMFTYNAKVNEPSLSGQDIINKALISCINNPEVVEAQKVDTILKPELHIEKSSKEPSYNYLDDITYIIKVSQATENAKAYNVVLKDELPKGLELDMNSFTFEGIKPEEVKVEKTDKGYMATLPTLEKEVTVTYKAKVVEPSLSGTTITNIANVTSSNSFDTVEATCDVDIYKPELHIEKTSEEPSYNYLDDITYIIKVSQTTENAKAYNVVLKDELPEGLELDMNSFTFEGINPEEVKVEKTDKGYMATLPTLEKEVTVTYKAKVVEPSLSGTTITNIANVTSSNSFDTVEATCDVNVLKPVFEINKTSDKEFYNINDDIHYTVKTKQVTPRAKAYKVVLNDANLNKGLKIDPESIVVNGLDEEDFKVEAKPQGYLLLHLDYMSDEEVQIDYDAQVVDPKLAGQKIEHEVSISCINNPQIVKWETSIENVVLKPEFSLSKTANVSKAKMDDTIQYNVMMNQTVENAKAFDVMFNDQLEHNQKLNPDSIQVISNQLEKDDYTIELLDNGFKIMFNIIDFKEPIHIQYDAQVINDDKPSTYNIAWIESESLDRIAVQTMVDIYKVVEPIKTGDDTMIASLGLLSLAGLGGIVLSTRKRKREE